VVERKRLHESRCQNFPSDHELEDREIALIGRLLGQVRRLGRILSMLSGRGSSLIFVRAGMVGFRLSGAGEKTCCGIIYLG
jgi:hypothetical protein